MVTAKIYRAQESFVKAAAIFARKLSSLLPFAMFVAGNPSRVGSLAGEVELERVVAFLEHQQTSIANHHTTTENVLYPSPEVITLVVVWQQLAGPNCGKYTTRIHNLPLSR